MSNILIVANELPYPPHKNGVCSTLFNLARCWKNDGHSVDIIYFSKADIANQEKLYEAIGVHAIAYDISGTEIFGKVCGKWVFKPRNCWHLQSMKCPEIDCSEYGYILLGSLAPALTIDQLKNRVGKVIFFEADSVSMYYERNYEQTTNLMRKAYLKLQKNCISNVEKILYEKVDAVSFVSEIDAEYTRARFKGNFQVNRIAVSIPPECEKKVDIDRGNGALNIGFSGIMDYEPNVRAVEYIINKIMPLLDSMGIDYKMHIIGKNPLDEWRHHHYAKEKKLIVTGFLNSIEEYIKAMDLYISPLFLGSGMKNKILQAMGIGVPMICSSVSVEGITEIVDQENCYLAGDDEQQWCDLICQLAEDINKRIEFSEKCKHIIKCNYSWEGSAKKLLGC